ncbi:hypothetical protein Acor_84580 [Acrocarpospora corrugata]|uniref:Uncharacterized protein n=1 Tax=Acrocarpospora corrugata TaxID=35763 RepID=A0A5M3WDH9_9ACTN|nr:hypothetical protein [Acrocarpospora corrugata]GES06389.1 hypothetical protein Acor_84580 [Acrocarpospora corrugata]
MTHAITHPDLSRLRGGALAWAVLDFIKTLPGPDAAKGPISHAPESWRSQRGMCFAGWTAELTGGIWYTKSTDWLNDYLIARKDDPPLSTHLAQQFDDLTSDSLPRVRDLWRFWILVTREVRGGSDLIHSDRVEAVGVIEFDEGADAKQPKRIIHASKRAAHLLDLGTDDPLHHPLFGSFNTIENLEYQLYGLYRSRSDHSPA